MDTHRDDFQILPTQPAGRIRTVVQVLFGDQWKFRMARAMGVGRTTLFEWLRGADTPADLDVQLVAAIRREQTTHYYIEKQLDALVMELGGGPF